MQFIDDSNRLVVGPPLTPEAPSPTTPVLINMVKKNIAEIRERKIKQSEGSKLYAKQEAARRKRRKAGRRARKRG